MQQQREPVRELARGKWAGILGPWLDERALAGKHTACPMCGGTDRFRFDDLEGSGTWICSHDGAGDGFHLLQGVMDCDFAEAAKYVEQHAGKVEAKPVRPGRSEDDIREALRSVWGGGLPLVDGDPVMAYLARRCGITAPPAGLRYHPALPHVDDDGVRTVHPAMLAQVFGDDRKPVTLHRTWLTPDGQKAAVKTAKKLMTPTRKMRNVAVRLAPVMDGWLGIAEGIETALAAGAKHGISVWSCCSAGMLLTFRPPPEVKMLCIFGDNDRSFTGQAAAYELARVVTNLGVECRVMIPETTGDDWASNVEEDRAERGST